MERTSRIWRIVGVLLGTVVVVLAAAFAWVWFAPCQLGGCAPVQNLAEYQAEGSELLDVDGEPFAMLATVNRRIVRSTRSRRTSPRPSSPSRIAASTSMAGSTSGGWRARW
jgi:hypothetical protein